MKKNYLVIAPFYPRNNKDTLVGGFINNPAYLWSRVAETGAKVNVITYGRAHKTWSYRGAKVHSIGIIPFKGIIYSVLLELKILFTLIRKIKKNNLCQIRIHHTGGLGIIFLKRFLGIKTPIVVTAHGTSMPEIHANEKSLKKKEINILKRISRWLQFKLDKLLYKYADIIISPSNFQLKEMVELYQIPKRKIKIIRHGYDESIYKYCSNDAKIIRQKMKIEDNKTIVLLVARAAPKKGIKEFIEMAKKYSILSQDNKKVHFIAIVGDPLHRRSEIDMVKVNKEQSENINIVRNLPEYELPKYYSMADVCVIPTFGYESIPSVLFEAIACKCNILASRLPGIEEVIDGKFLKDNEPVSMAKDLKDMIDNDFTTKVKIQCSLKKLLTKQMNII